MKWLLRIIIVLVVLIGGFLWFGWSQLDKIIKFGIESGTPPVVQTSVKVDGVKLSPFSGTGVIEGFVIGNPEGFTGPYALRIGTTDIALDTNSVSGDKIVIQHIKILDPEINLEAGLGGTNLKHIADNAKAFASKQVPAAAAANPQTAPSAEGKPKKTIKLQVNEILITGAKVSASAAGLVPGASKTVTLPEIHLTGLGIGAEGITPAALTAQILSRLSSEAAKASAGGAVKNLLQGENGAKIGGGVNKLLGR
jgi:hypothetical protein